MDRSSQEKISKSIVELNTTISQWDVMDIYRLLYPTTVGCTIFSSSHGTFTKIDHNLGHKTHLNQFERIEILQSMFSEHSGIKLEINSREIAEKSQNTWS